MRRARSDDRRLLTILLGPGLLKRVYDRQGKTRPGAWAIVGGKYGHGRNLSKHLPNQVLTRTRARAVAKQAWHLALVAPLGARETNSFGQSNSKPNFFLPDVESQLAIYTIAVSKFMHTLISSSKCTKV